MPAISIICPVYNAEKYIHKCIDSVLKQTFTDFELLLIDDGSPDCSGRICDEYAEKDSRVQVFHKENGGVASARQMGLDNAKGEYTIHVDPDDWVEPNMLEELYVKAKETNADMVICDYWVNYKKYERYQVSGQHRDNSTLYLKDIICKYHGSLCNKLIKRSCYYQPQQIDFIPGQNLFEDLIVCAKILINPRRIVYLNKAFYHYAQINPDSYTRNKKMYDDRLRLNNILFSLLDSNEYFLERIYLKKIEAYYALKENIFRKKEYINKYIHLKDYITESIYDNTVNKALVGFYNIEYCYINTRDFIKAIIRKML